jgi:hypothetical protein
MKSILLYALGSLLLLEGATACSKEDPAPDFYIRATKDATPWAGTGSGSYSKTKKQFYVSGQMGNISKAEVIMLGFSLPASPQLAPVQALPASWAELIGYDAASNSYETADAASLPDIEVTRLDTVAKIVEGRFNAILVRDKHWTSQTENMNLTHGSFRVQYTVVK